MESRLKLDSHELSIPSCLAQPEAFHPERWLDAEENGGIEPILLGFSCRKVTCAQKMQLKDCQPRAIV